MQQGIHVKHTAPAVFNIGPTPEEAGQDDALAFKLTQNERTHAAWAATYLEQLRRDRNRKDDAKALAGVLWQESQA
jgi:hypothetical protein